MDRRSTGVAPPGPVTSALALAQERVQHGRGGVQVGDDAVPQRVEHLDVLRLLVGQRVGFLAHRGDLAHRRVDGDRGRLLDHDAAARHPDERIDRAKVNGHAASEAHGAPFCPT
jgi:hypothetical protein